MNAARARRRWEKWRRYSNRLIKLSEHDVATPATWQAYNEWAHYRNMGLWGFRGAKRYRRRNRRAQESRNRR